MFVVLESLDGGGKGAQRSLVAARLRQQGFFVDDQEFPNHQGCLYKEFIHPALHNHLAMAKRDLFTTFALDQSLCSPRIRQASKKGFFLADGYFTTNLAYQIFIGKVSTLALALQLSAFLDLPRPDLAVYIDLSPQTALARKATERGHDEGPDVYEKDLAFQTELRVTFKKMCQEQIYSPWQVVDGEKSLEEVTEAILSILQSK